jgi:signal transduction histidine kinase
MDSVIDPKMPNLVQHRNLVEAELVGSVAWLIRIRWIAGVGVLVATWIVSTIFRLRAPVIPLYAIGAGILAYNLVFHLWAKKLAGSEARADQYIQLAKWQVGMDWLAMSLLIHYSGGIESPAIMFFFFHIIIAAIFFPPRTALAFALFAIGLVSGIAILEFTGLLSHQPISGLLPFSLYQNGLYVIAILFFFSTTALTASYLTSSIHERLRQREEEIVHLTESLQAATLRLQALNDGARLVGSTLDLPQVLERLVKSTAEAMVVRACSIRLLDSSGQKLDPVAVYGLSQAYLNKGPVELESNPLARQVLAGKIVNIPDAPSSPLLQYPEEARQEGIQSMLSAPLVGKKGPMGVLRAYAVEPQRFTPEDEAFLSAIAAQGSIAIENALAYRDIEALDVAKTQFIRIVTHELRSPVSVTRSLLRNIVAGYAGQVTEQQQDILSRASRRVDFLQKLIDDLLDLAAGKTEVKEHEKLEPVPLEEAIDRVVKRYEIPAQEKSLNLDWQDKTGEEPIIVMATLDGLDRIFNNLISNAVKYTPSGGRVSVTLSTQDGEAQVRVEDTGIGIPEEAMSHLFEEFYRAPNAKALEREGTGLGLTIVKDMVNRFGGEISVESSTETGSKFTITLPVNTQGVHQPDLHAVQRKAEE